MVAVMGTLERRGEDTPFDVGFAFADSADDDAGFFLDFLIVGFDFVIFVEDRGVFGVVIIVVVPLRGIGGRRRRRRRFLTRSIRLHDRPGGNTYNRLMVFIVVDLLVREAVRVQNVGGVRV